MKITMMNKAFAVLAAGLLFTQAGHAASVEVEWQNPDQYRDIRSTNGGQQRFEQQVMSELDEHFQKEAARLPADQTLHISVANVDLAGEVEYFHWNQPFGLRVIRRVDSPSLTLNYELRDARDQVVSAGEDRLRDLGFRFSNLMPMDRSPLKYEKEMISEWYRVTFGDKAAS